jgi:hypothetical protein
MESSGARSRTNRKAPSSSFLKLGNRSHVGRLEGALGKEPRSIWMRPRVLQMFYILAYRDPANLAEESYQYQATSHRAQPLPQSRQAPAAHEKMSLRHRDHIRFGALLRRVVQRQRDCPLQGRLVRKGLNYRTIVGSSRGKNSFPVLWPYTCISHVAQSLRLGLMDQRFVLGTWPQVHSSSHDCALSTSEGSIMEQPRGFQCHYAERKFQRSWRRCCACLVRRIGIFSRRSLCSLGTRGDTLTSLHSGSCSLTDRPGELSSFHMCVLELVIADHSSSYFQALEMQRGAMSRAV